MSLGSFTALRGKKATPRTWSARRSACGFRGIDTACQPKHYHEPGVGAGVAACLRGEPACNGNLAREDLYLQTKFTALSGQDPARTPYDPKVPLPEQVRQSLAVSLRNLQTDYLDGLLLHSPFAKRATDTRGLAGDGVVGGCPPCQATRDQ